MTQRVAVVGIDGSGKSTLVRRCAERAGAARGVLTLACPAYHETPNGPLHALSQTLERFSEATDRLGSPGLKAASMYLQMTLYGPVERFLIETFEPTTILSERHALIDPVAYSPLYQKLIGPVDPALEASLRADVGEADWLEVLDWQAREARRLGVERTLWEIPPLLVELSKQPWDELLRSLQTDFRCKLPDVVVLLDVPVETALERVAERAGTREVHEGQALLTALRQAYLALLEVLSASFGVQTEVLDGTQSLDALTDALSERVGLA